MRTYVRIVPGIYLMTALITLLCFALELRYSFFKLLSVFSEQG